MSNGVFYFITNTGDNFNNETGYLYGIDAGTGKMLWVNSVPALILGFAVSAKTVYVSTKFEDIHAFDSGNGEPVWQINVPGLDTAPHIADGMVVLGTSTDLGDCIEARGEATGEPVGEYCDPGEGGGYPSSLSGVWGGEVYGYNNDYVYVLNAGTGDVRLRVPRPPGLPIYHVADGIAFGRASHKLNAMDVTTGAFLWNI